MASPLPLEEDRAAGSGYPHVRGEKGNFVHNFNRVMLVSPRAWGEGGDGQIWSKPSAGIPTCVGRRGFGYGGAHETQWYPHVRGEKGITKLKVLVCLGSSPRAWGKEGYYGYCSHQRRIIPTCVGKRGVLRLLFTSTTDHPHVRGEKSIPTAYLSLFRGSSPRAWGKGL